jgi:hypothetical protein
MTMTLCSGGSAFLSKLAADKPPKPAPRIKMTLPIITKPQEYELPSMVKTLLYYPACFCNKTLVLQDAQILILHTDVLEIMKPTLLHENLESCFYTL